MTLTDLLRRHIIVEGPISIASYMQEALWHPEFGYYTMRDPLGAGGDFVTAPEISQMFGEVLGLCLAQTWMDQGRPAPFTLAELGPGRGTLMADILRATRSVPGFSASADIIFLENSPVLREIQAEALPNTGVRWINKNEDLPQQPLILVANEFFDALPIRQFVRDGEVWRERQVGLSQGGLVFGLGAPQPQPALALRLGDTRDGDIVEHCPAAAPVMAAIASRLAAHGGAAVLIDYGNWRCLGDTLQAMRRHRHVDPLNAPGTADLTAHVDFGALATAASGCAHTHLTPQGVFLERLGITARAQHLARRAKGGALERVIRAHRRLTHPEEMGQHFKVIGFYPSDAAAPPGLEP